MLKKTVTILKSGHSTYVLIPANIVKTFLKNDKKTVLTFDGEKITIERINNHDNQN